MPLAFESTTHGTVAFGFFNVRSDMLLLENRFFFATDFCRGMGDLAGAGAAESAASWTAWTIERPEQVGDLHGAIRGRRFTGFIGDTYRRYPFPAAPADFKQAPEGDGTQGEIAAMIEKYARRDRVRLAAERSGGTAAIDGIGFGVEGFRELLRYVWRGGYPRWRDELKPAYVVAMRRAIEAGSCWLFEGMDWTV
jgi:hypothetical protein